MGLVAVTDQIHIYNFDRFNDRYVLDHQSGLLEAARDAGGWKEEEGGDFGNLKRFLVGPTVIAYRYQNTPYLRVGDQVERIGADVKINRRKIGPMVHYSIQCGSIRVSALDTRWMDLASRATDPTYDEVDQWAGDFAGYLKDLSGVQVG